MTRACGKFMLPTETVGDLVGFQSLRPHFTASPGEPDHSRLCIGQVRSCEGSQGHCRCRRDVSDTAGYQTAAVLTRIEFAAVTRAASRAAAVPQGWGASCGWAEVFVSNSLIEAVDRTASAGCHGASCPRLELSNRGWYKVFGVEHCRSRCGRQRCGTLSKSDLLRGQASVGAYLVGTRVVGAVLDFELCHEAAGVGRTVGGQASEGGAFRPGRVASRQGHSG